MSRNIPIDVARAMIEAKREQMQRLRREISEAEQRGDQQTAEAKREQLEACR